MLIEKAPLRKLTLVSLDLNDVNLQELWKFVKRNSNLVELDICWNKIQPKSLLRFVDDLKKLNQL